MSHSLDRFSLVPTQDHLVRNRRFVAWCSLRWNLLTLRQVVDFVIWKLFKQCGYQKPQHLLTHGFQRPTMGQSAQNTNIQGIVCRFPNHNVETLKDSPWAEVLGLLGSNGEEIMMRLLFDCGVFAAIDARKGVYYQLSGIESPRDKTASSVLIVYQVCHYQACSSGVIRLWRMGRPNHQKQNQQLIQKIPMKRSANRKTPIHVVQTALYFCADRYSMVEPSPKGVKPLDWGRHVRWPSGVRCSSSS